jgi:dephospho-CoA kinase
MVIFIAGLIGTGKTSLAKALAKRLGFYYYDVDEIKKEVYKTDPNYDYNLDNNIPFSDETRIKTFNRVVLDFEKLSKKYKNIIVDETLHKKSLRKILFDGAKKYFGDYLIVWIKADEGIIKERLEKDKREGHILKDSFGMYLSLKKQFEDFDDADVVFNNSFKLDDSVKQLGDILVDNFLR